jgi:ketosteroid isomerase-like protein
MTPREVVERAHACVKRYDIAFVDWIAEDGIVEFPFAPEGMPRRVQGREALLALYAPRYQKGRESGRTIEYENVRLYETNDPEVIIIEFEAEIQGPAGKTRLPFVQVFRVRNDKIVEQRDYFDAINMAQRLKAT